MTMHSCLLWASDRFEQDEVAGEDVTVLAADSWLVAEGQVLALELHRARFFAAFTPEQRGRLRLDEFWAASLDRIPLAGDWFPRVELRQAGRIQRLAFRLRSAPPLGTTLTALTHDGHDPRRRPSIKGPDLATLGRLRRDVGARGADEAIILNEAGAIVDGCSTAILWWRGDTLCAPPTHFARVDSVTAKTLVALATAVGSGIRYEAAQPRELDALEVWAVNALHGIRTITTWIDGPAMLGPSARASAWQARLDALARPLRPPRP
ncbi:aminotransferase class IV [Parafrigoribacterium mesophilum]|uniref:aminotransferase class IV n=1 Tax=Parafrigoribacterium mesophilum TaxID=433646 RepID=UPI0031FD47FA